MLVAAVVELAKSPNAVLVMIPGDVADGFTRAAALLAEGGLARQPAARTDTSLSGGTGGGPWGADAGRET